MSNSALYKNTLLHIRYELIPPCDTRRREKVEALYNVVSDLLAVISRAYPQFLSPAPQNIIIVQPCMHSHSILLMSAN